jgi:hypothetical protein
MLHRHRDLETLKSDIISLCNSIYEERGIRNISFDDINECEWCLSHLSYAKYFKEQLGMTLAQFISSIGFIPNKAGRGMVYTFDDGEITSSKWEYKVSTFLRENNISYKRNVKYKDFVSPSLNYTGNKDCDYVIDLNGETLYLEVAGVIDLTKQRKENDVRIKYNKQLKEKEDMLIESGLNYRIIYPHEIKYEINFDILTNTRSDPQ